MRPIDLRSDTVTRPSAGMREAMRNAEVGDDVFGEDPTVNALQERVASMFGMEAGLFVPTGTMANEICVKLHTEPGDEIIAGENSHIVVYETGGPGLLSGVQIQAVPDEKGILDAERVGRAVRPDFYLYPKTRLVCVENTHGRSGGTVYPLDRLRDLWVLTREKRLRLHIDGARIWNASVASGVALGEYGRYADTISVCFSKGLGAPVGSMILSDRKNIERARKYRKIFGGSMRQAGILAAGAMFALDHHVDLLRDDHEKARIFASELTGRSQQVVLTLLSKAGVLLTPERDTALRAVMHLDVTAGEVRTAATRITETL